MTWTASIEDTQWFAGRFGLPDPAVFCTVAEARDVFAYTNDREEKEFLLCRRRHLEVTRVWPTKGDNVAEVFREIQERRNQRERLRLDADLTFGH
jgi:hypothetical protein